MQYFNVAGHPPLHAAPLRAPYSVPSGLTWPVSSLPPALCSPSGPAASGPIRVLSITSLRPRTITWRGGLFIHLLALCPPGT